MRVEEALALAWSHFSEKRFAAAERVVRQLIQQRPDLANAHYLLGLLAIEAKKLPEAMQVFERAIAIAPASPTLNLALGEVARRLGQSDRAERHARQAIALKGDFAEAHNNLGILLMEKGDAEGALASYERALRFQPRFAQALSNKGNALHRLKRMQAAEECYRAAIALDGTYAEAHNNLGTTLRDLGDLLGSIAAYRAALQLMPHYREANLNLAHALKEAGQPNEALTRFDAALAQTPDNSELLTFKASALIDLGRFDDARGLLQRSLVLAPHFALTHALIGRILHEDGRLSQAEQSYRRALHYDPNYADAHNNLGATLRALGRKEEAVASFDRALALRPHLSGAFHNIMDTITVSSPDEPHMRKIEAQLDRPQGLRDEQKTLLHYALGKAYDDLGRTDAAFAQWAEGARLKRMKTPYLEQAALDHHAAIMAAFNAELLQAKRSLVQERAQAPIIILGMPRSGSTLIEQIIASHPDVSAIGEVPDLHRTAAILKRNDGGTIAYPHYASSLDAIALGQIADTYLARLQRRQPANESGRPRMTDKLPANYLYLGLIHLALPNARIIHVARDPLDTCLSCFSKLFTYELGFSYDLGELGRYYRSYHALMAHWRAALPAGSFLDIRYEDVVGNLEGQARALLDYCGLSWNPAVLKFHETNRPVKTASSAQVRQPLYASSVGRWRAYQAHLTPLIEALGPDLTTV